MAEPCDEVRVIAFLAGDLGDHEVAVFDAHLLDCDACWAAMDEDRRGRAAARMLREPAPATLGERVRAATADVCRPSRRHRSRWLVGAAVAGLAAMVGGTTLISHSRGPTDAPPLAMVVRLAQSPSASGDAAGALTLWWAESASGPVVVAEGSSPFPMPSDALATHLGDSRVWVARRGGVRLLCLMAPRHALLAGRVSEAELTAVARAYGLLA